MKTVSELLLKSMKTRDARRWKRNLLMIRRRGGHMLTSNGKAEAGNAAKAKGRGRA